MTHLGRILVVDDEPKIRSFIGRALAAAGYVTQFAASGAEAVRGCAGARYDLVILDLVIGDMDGREVLGELLTARPDQAVIVLSCVADVAAKVDLLERGAQDYLTKPFSLAELLARVRVRLREEPRYDGAVASAVTAPQPRPLVPPQRAPRPALGGHGPGEVIKAGRVVLDIGKLVADNLTTSQQADDIRVVVGELNRLHRKGSEFELTLPVPVRSALTSAPAERTLAERTLTDRAAPPTTEDQGSSRR